MEIESCLLVGVNGSDAPNEKEQSVPLLAAVTAVGEPTVATAGPIIDAANGHESHGRTVQELEKRTDPSHRSLQPARREG